MSRVGWVLVAMMSCAHAPPLQGRRCTLRIMETGVLVDGERSSRAAAIDYCKRTTEGAVIAVDDRVPPATVESLRSALRREGILIVTTGHPTDETRFLFGDPVRPSAEPPVKAQPAAVPTEP